MSPASQNLRGAALVAAGMTSFTLSDVCMKALGEGGMPLSQSLGIRGALVLAATAVWALGAGGWQGVARRDWGLMGLRGAGEAAAAWCFFTALLVMPLANIAAVMQATPLVLALAAWPVLGQRPGPVRIAAILAGLVGVALIVRPGAEGWGWPVGLALVAVGFVTLRDLASRTLAPGVPNALVVAVTAAGVAASTLPAVALGSGWVAVGAREGALLAGTSVLVIGGYAGIAAGMRAGEVAFVAPFRYTGLLVALVAGFAVFGSWPDGLTLLGAGVLVAAGTVTLWRERRAARAGG
jgi:drug/metabolite transporter (DMT)-like permease